MSETSVARVGLALVFVVLAVLLIGCGSPVKPSGTLEGPAGLSLEREEYDLLKSKYANKIFLTWEPSPIADLKDYQVYRSYEQIRPEETPRSEYELIGVAATNTFTDTELEVSPCITNIYYYRVSVINAAGIESPLSDAVSIRYTPYGLS